jgi:hypothetical protein
MNEATSSLTRAALAARVVAVAKELLAAVNPGVLPGHRQGVRRFPYRRQVAGMDRPRREHQRDQQDQATAGGPRRTTSMGRV